MHRHESAARRKPRLIGLAALALATACSAAPILGGRFAPGAVPDGAYEGDYRAFPDHVWVRVEVADGRIAACEVTKTRGVFKKTGAETEIPARIVAAQSTDVDAVSGATLLSRAIMNAANAALAAPQGAAGGEP